MPSSTNSPIGGVVLHVTDVGAEDELAAELVEVADFVFDGVHVMGIGGDGGAEHFQSGDHGHVFANGRGEECIVDAVGVVGGVGEDVDATVDGDAHACEVGGMGKDEPAVEMRGFDGGFGDVEGHGEDVSALDP